MMSFKQYLLAQPLEEGFVRSAALLAWRNKHKAESDGASSDDSDSHSTDQPAQVSGICSSGTFHK